MITQHTPGPWFASRARNRRKYVFGPDERPVASGFSCRGDEAEGNANLIAAAPELLAALMMVMACADSCSSSAVPSKMAIISPRLADQINSAIAKAEGR
jgi:hypothetical protein